MKGQWKGFVSGLAVATLVFGLGAPALAATVRQLNASYSGIKITMDGKEIVPTDASGAVVEPFAVDGTTYLPVRAVANAMGLDVTWDGQTQTVKLSTPNTTATTGYSRSNPAPIGTAQTVAVENILEKYTATITITESYRGTDAYKMLQEANDIWNGEAPEGKEYIVVKVTATVSSSDADKAVHFTAYNFKHFSANNSEYTNDTMIIAPKPQFSGDAYVGGTIEGYMALLVDKNDTAPKTVFGVNYDGTGGVWFSLTK